jgi:hypothetical protein
MKEPVDEIREMLDNEEAPEKLKKHLYNGAFWGVIQGLSGLCLAYLILRYIV